MSNSKVRDRILKIGKEEVEFKEEKKRLLVELQKQCKHEAIIETPYQSHLFGISSGYILGLLFIYTLEQIYKKKISNIRALIFELILIIIFVNLGKKIKNILIL